MALASTASSALARLMNQTVSVETLAGPGAYGDTYAVATAVPCYIEDGYKLVRNNQGEEVVSTTTLYASFDDTALFAVDSRVTVNGRTATVIATRPRTGGSAGLPDHVEVHLT